MDIGKTINMRSVRLFEIRRFLMSNKIEEDCRSEMIFRVALEVGSEERKNVRPTFGKIINLVVKVFLI